MPGYVWDHFAPSVKMSSYLVAFLISDFISIPADPGTSNVQFRIWARANARNLTSYVEANLKFYKFRTIYNRLDMHNVRIPFIFQYLQVMQSISDQRSWSTTKVISTSPIPYRSRIWRPFPILNLVRLILLLIVKRISYDS